ncbi:hypothetical protein [Paenibacillus sonchi]|uniref:hypothetical protein n=1 Tax=Paenibacillus sonchi TaxID=373687 RepID=UPI001E50605D|nr:hypothetical protein [Paenibacillus sonchi]
MSLLVVVSACTKAGGPTDGVSAAPHTAAMAVTSSSPSPTPIANPKVRAAGESEFGKLEIRSSVQENVEPLGAPSCYGTAEDYKISGTYKVQFTDTANTVTELALPSLTGFIQPRNETLGHYDFLPKTELKVEKGLLEVRHGGAPGNEAVIEQHFKPDFAKHVMERVS